MGRKVFRWLLVFMAATPSDPPPHPPHPSPLLQFGILMKQLLYFDRYTQILAPGLQVYQDSRVDIANDVRQGGF